MCSSNTNVVGTARDQTGGCSSTRGKLMASFMLEPGTCEADTKAFHLAGLVHVGFGTSDCCGGNLQNWGRLAKRLLHGEFGRESRATFLMS